MKIDVLQFLAMPDKSLNLGYSRQTHSLGSACDVITPIDSSGYGQWKHIKNPRGWPWDLKLYDEFGVYDWITEGSRGWSPDPNVGPKSFKKNIHNRKDAAGKDADGIKMFPRYVDTQDTRFETSYGANQTVYAIFEDCSQVGPEQSLGAIRHVLRGPFMIFHGGDVGMQPTLIHQYYWNDNGIPTLEENHYAFNWGWVAWKLQHLDKKTGFYEVGIDGKGQLTETIDIMKWRVDQIKVVFPCF